MFHSLCFMKNIAASAATTNTDPKVETMMISLDVSPKIIHKPWEKKQIIKKKPIKLRIRRLLWPAYKLAGQVEEITSGYVNIISRYWLH